MKRDYKKTKFFESWELTGMDFQARIKSLKSSFLVVFFVPLTIHSPRNGALGIEELRACLSAPMKL